MQKEEAVDQRPSAVQFLLAVPAGEQAPVRTEHTCVCWALASRPSEPVPSVPSQGDSWVLPAGVSQGVWSTRGTRAGICLAHSVSFPSCVGWGLRLRPDGQAQVHCLRRMASPPGNSAMAGLTRHTVGLLPGSAHCCLDG